MLETKTLGRLWLNMLEVYSFQNYCIRTYVVSISTKHVVSIGSKGWVSQHLAIEGMYSYSITFYVTIFLRKIAITIR